MGDNAFAGFVFGIAVAMWTFGLLALTLGVISGFPVSFGELSHGDAWRNIALAAFWTAVGVHLYG